MIVQIVRTALTACSCQLAAIEKPRLDLSSCLPLPPQNLYLEEEMLPMRRRHSELTAENRRLAQRVRSAEAQLEYAGRLMKQPGKNGANWRASLPPQALELADSFMPPFPTEPADVPSPTRQSKDDAVSLRSPSRRVQGACKMRAQTFLLPHGFRFAISTC